MTEELSPVDRAEFLGSASLRKYYEIYLASFGGAYVEFVKLLAESAPEDKPLLLEAFSRGFGDEAGRAFTVVLAEKVGISEEEIGELLGGTPMPKGPM